MSAPLAASTLDALLERAIDAGASDLHLTAGQAPALRVHGALLTPPDLPPLPGAAVDALVGEVLNAAQREAFARERSVDLALERPARAPGARPARFRVNVFSERGRAALAIRRLDDHPRPLCDLRLPASLERLAALEDGLVLVVGPTGSGKTTTIAALLDLVNRARACHIVTLEDPIEYVHEGRRALVHQRELHVDFRRFSQGLRSALREDPDVILVGELRDLPTMRAALMAAETGHLVLSSLHSGGAVLATERLIGGFRGDEREAVRHQLSLVLRAVVAQHLLPLKDGSGRFPAVEVLHVTPAVANLLRTARTAQIQAAVEGQAQQGLLTLEQSLCDAVVRGWVDEAIARAAARDPSNLDERLRLARGRGRP